MKLTTKTTLGIGILSFISYTVCYNARNLLSYLLTQIKAEGTFDEVLLGNMMSAFLLAYGCGQLINGIAGVRFSPRYMVALGLMVPAGILLLITVIKTAFMAIVLWGLCGFFCSMLWGPLSGMIGENTSFSVGRMLLSALTVASISGALVASMMSLCGIATGSWRVAFALSGVIGFFCAVIWFLGSLFMERKGWIHKKTRRRSAKKANGEQTEEEEPVIRLTLGRFLNAGFVFMLVVTMLNGIVRNATVSWIPAFLDEGLQFSKELSTLLAAILPFTNLAGVALVLLFGRLFFDDEKKQCALFFTVSAVCFLVVLGLYRFAPVGAVIALFFACAVMQGVCNILFSSYVLRFKDTGALSGVTGALDCASYVTAAGANVFFTFLFSDKDWSLLVLSWFIVAALGIVFSLLSRLSNKDVGEARLEEKGTEKESAKT